MQYNGIYKNSNVGYIRAKKHNSPFFASPECGFSRQCVALLAKYDARYGHFDILSDEQVRQGLKEYSKWPTYPQLYVDGQLLGGLDILKEMDEAGELAEALPKEETLNQRLEKLIKQAGELLIVRLYYYKYTSGLGAFR